jgi:hypothetical protein
MFGGKQHNLKKRHSACCHIQFSKGLVQLSCHTPFMHAKNMLFKSQLGQTIVVFIPKVKMNCSVCVVCSIAIFSYSKLEIA